MTTTMFYFVLVIIIYLGWVAGLKCHCESLSTLQGAKQITPLVPFMCVYLGFESLVQSIKKREVRIFKEFCLQPQKSVVFLSCYANSVKSSNLEQTIASTINLVKIYIEKKSIPTKNEEYAVTRGNESSIVDKQAPDNEFALKTARPDGKLVEKTGYKADTESYKTPDKSEMYERFSRVYENSAIKGETSYENTRFDEAAKKLKDSQDLILKIQEKAYKQMTTDRAFKQLMDEYNKSFDLVNFMDCNFHKKDYRTNNSSLASIITRQRRSFKNNKFTQTVDLFLPQLSEHNRLPQISYITIQEKDIYSKLAPRLKKDMYYFSNIMKNDYTNELYKLQDAAIGSQRLAIILSALNDYTNKLDVVSNQYVFRDLLDSTNEILCYLQKEYKNKKRNDFDVAIKNKEFSLNMQLVSKIKTQLMSQARENYLSTILQECIIDKKARDAMLYAVQKDAFLRMSLKSAYELLREMSNTKISIVVEETIQDNSITGSNQM